MVVLIREPRTCNQIQKRNNKNVRRQNWKLRKALSRIALDTIIVSDEDTTESPGKTLPMEIEPTTTRDEVLFYESRVPNDGKIVTPIYDSAAPSIPSSTPIEEDPPIIVASQTKNHICDYSLISDTSMLLTGNESSEEIVIKDDESPANTEAVKGGSETEGATGAEDGELVDCTIEDGEIIELEGQDDSVIFVSEQKPLPMPSSSAKDFIPLPIVDSKNMPVSTRFGKIVQNLKRKADNLRKTVFKGDQKKAKLQPEPVAATKRMIIIDGSNVAYQHKENGCFSARGLEICLDYFLSKGFDAKAVIPQFRMKRALTDDQDIMMNLEKKKLLIKTPAKDLGGEFAASYDDRFILNIAKEFDAAIVSNDHFRDLIRECDEFRFLIYNRVIGYTWVKDSLFIPSDPYGKIGPNLNDILYIKQK